MSIINDALKKVQAQLDKKGAKMNDSSQNPAESPKDPNEKDQSQPKKPDISGGSEGPNVLKVNNPQTESSESDFIRQNLQHIEKQKTESATPVAQAPKAEDVPVAVKTPTQTDFKRLFIMLIILGVLAFVAYKTYEKSLQKPQAKVIRAVKKIQPKQAIEKVMKEVNIKPVLPVQLPAAKEKISGLTLNGIVMMNNRRVALINNEIYEVGDFAEGKKILVIEETYVVVQSEKGHKRTLKVKSGR